MHHLRVHDRGEGFDDDRRCDAAVLGVGVNLGLIQRARSVWTGMHLPVSPMGVQLTFFFSNE